MNREEFRKIKNIVLFCKNRVPYYRKLLANFEIKDISDFSKIPILTNEIYRLNTPPKNENLLSEKNIGYFVFSSGGTTSEPRYILRDFKDINYQSQDYEGLNLGRGDTVINLFMPGMWGVFTTANITLMNLGCRIIPFGGTDLSNNNKEKIAGLIEEFKVNTLIGVPSTVMTIAKYIYERSKHQSCRFLINKIFTLGEKIQPSVYYFLKKIFPNVLIKSKYGTMEAAGIGYQCSCLDKNYYHPFSNRLVEIVDPQNQKPLPLGKKGIILVTTLNYRLVPLLRFSTGDVGILLRKRCSCGREEILKVEGRLQDMIISASVHFTLNQIESIISAFPETSPPVFQIEINNPKGLDEITLRIETNKITPQLKNNILEKIYKEIPDLPEALNSKKILNFKIDFFPPQFLPRQKSTGKIKRIIDLRK